MQLNLRGKTALITGSSRGIGFEIAKALHSQGCRVALNGRNLDLLISSSNKLTGSIYLLGDVSIEADAQRVVMEAVKKLGKLDILICNVGGGESVPPGEESSFEWNRVFKLNLWSATNVIESARSHLIKSKGVILCISSICGLEVIPKAPLTYSAAKAALHSYVRGIARPFGSLGIRINALALGNILFENSVWSKKIKENELDVSNMLKNHVPLKTMGTPKDVADLAIFLVSDLAKFATGGVWTLDGGQTH